MAAELDLRRISETDWIRLVIFQTIQELLTATPSARRNVLYRKNPYINRPHPRKSTLLLYIFSL